MGENLSDTDHIFVGTQNELIILKMKLVSEVPGKFTIEEKARKKIPGLKGVAFIKRNDDGVL